MQLWVFGGVYVDTDFLPTGFTPRTIDKYDDGFLLLDLDTQMLSTKLMALSPRHPIMYYAVHQMLLSMLLNESSLTVDEKHPTVTLQRAATRAKFENGISGSSILNQAFQMFREEHEIEGERIISPGIFHGVMNRTVHVIPSSGLNAKIHGDRNDNDKIIDTKSMNFITRIFKSESEKKIEYEKMGMVIYSEEDEAWSEANDRVTHSCLIELYNPSRDSISVS